MIDLNTIPKAPGVYLFKDKLENIIYVGKAKNLRSRVSSYFSNTEHSAKTRALVKNIAHHDYIIVDNELEALLLENNLIKQHSPKYNINLKDAKTYAYIVITNDEFPRILITRKVGKKGNYFGPFTSGSTHKELIHIAIKLFKLRICRSLPKHTCLNYHIGLCTAPCIKNVNSVQYQLQVKNAIDFLKGNTKEILSRINFEMRQASQLSKFEVALEKKRQIDAINHLNEKQKVDVIKSFDQDVLAIQTLGDKSIIELLSIKKGVISGKKEFRFDTQEDLLESFIKLYYSQTIIPHEIIVNTQFWNSDFEKQILELYLTNLKGSQVCLICPKQGEKHALIKIAEKNALSQIDNTILKELREKLSIKEIPTRIECFDISNLGYDFIVAGMTQWINGKPNKQGYKKFNIKTVIGKNDDFASMQEVVFRRYSRLSKEHSVLPNLIIIDGGALQLKSASNALKTLKLEIPIIALAKEREEIYTQTNSEPLRFNINSPMMLLLRQIRDSVHTFVLSHNRKRRQIRFKEEIKKI